VGALCRRKKQGMERTMLRFTERIGEGKRRSITTTKRGKAETRGVREKAEKARQKNMPRRGGEGYRLRSEKRLQPPSCLANWLRRLG